MPHHTPLIATLALGFVVAFLFGLIANRLKLSPIVGYLAAGVLVGPYTPGVVANAEMAAELAEVGVILLMFGVGLHFSYKDLFAVRKIAIPGAVAQITAATLLGMGIALVLGAIVYRSVKLHELPRILYDSGRFAALSLFCIGTASAFGWTLAYFKVPLELVNFIEEMGLGLLGTGIMVAVAFLLIGMFIDAIPAIIILGTVLYPVTQHVGMHPIHFAIVGVMSLAFGLVTPPYGLCLLIAAAIGEIPLLKALKDVVIILLPMLAVLMLIIVFPDLILALPRWIMPKFVN